MPHDFLTAKEAALTAEVHSQEIYALVRTGRLRAHRHGRRVLIESASFKKWKTALEVRRRLAAEERIIDEELAHAEA
jgi:excisionase family DNA binding protein